ncbi:signal recognition particle-docking protein FtsY [Helicobacter equorum]|uniref:signal recognition particle-docking protein FtsY n=1 Tax=Helicobacter equorum TaxID=361872 RepID=UPI000CF1A839|nr:signal recognition particle-docking protein FtsY [Helicobacter equorum]
MFSLLAKTMKKTTSNITSLLGSKKEKIHKEELEQLLIESDVAYDVVESLLDSLPTHSTREQLQNSLTSLLTPHIYSLSDTPYTLEVLLIIGINGAGKTTTIAKLAYKYKQEGKKVLLGAGDTFRAAAIEQLKGWGEKLQIPVISTQHGHDPSALAFDAISSAYAKGYDILLLDTAGRLHTQTNLTNELLKIIRVSEKALAGHTQDTHIRKFLILDGTQGNSSITQAKHFSQHTTIDGIIVTKLDGTSKGGAIISIISELQIPVLYLGVGEGAQDLLPFDAQTYITTLLDSIFV